jgi:hypothetical protein
MPAVVPLLASRVFEDAGDQDPGIDHGPPIGTDRYRPIPRINVNVWSWPSVPGKYAKSRFKPATGHAPRAYVCAACRIEHQLPGSGGFST